MKYDFKQDLVEGQKVEREVAEKLSQRDGFSEVEIMEGNVKEIDIKANYKGRVFTFEVKYDQMASKTGNIAVEYETRQCASGLSVTKADYWVYKINDSHYVLKTEKLKRKLYQQKRFKRKVIGGDAGSNTKMFLVEMERFISWCTKL